MNAGTPNMCANQGNYNFCLNAGKINNRIFTAILLKHV